MFETQLEKAAFSHKDERDRIIQDLAKHPDDTLSEAIRVLNHPLKVYWEVATQVIRAIGYSRNAEAIPTLLAHVGDQNSLAWNEAVQTLVDMGPQVVVPHLLLNLWNRDRQEYWGEDVEGICSLLYEVDQEYAKQCGPLITYILSRDDLPPPHDLDRGFLLNVLEKIGNDCAEYALPTLIDFVRKEGKSAGGLQARRLIASFSEEVLRPYTYLLVSPQDVTL
jgi:hypothetical protein